MATARFNSKSRSTRVFVWDASADGHLMMSRPVVLALLLSILSASCVEGPPFAEAEAETSVELHAGQSESLQFEVEAEAIGEIDERFRIVLQHPSPAEQSQRGITVERSWDQGWDEEEDWPETITIEAGERFLGDFHLHLTNNTHDPLELQVEVRLIARPFQPFGSAGGEESLKLAIRQRGP